MKKILLPLVCLYLVLAVWQNAYSLSPELSGNVVETMDSGRYTYVNLENNGEKIWLAVPKMKVVKGQFISFKPGDEIRNFESFTLKRKFDKIFFSAGPSDQKEAISEMKSPGSSGNVITTADKIKVEKASGQENVYTIAELYKNRDTLDKHEIVVRGKAVKISANIMNKNWIHLQDGSGDPEKGSHDLVVTSQDLPAVGELVTFRGTLYKDKDFGSGYNYNLILENAGITQ